ncbi:hypothetical protein F5Y16DRAFT_417339 [Xylariaceae sp. FL0255]|nr:hypothetical protein F5Y16DRAFT_417339 [Xylariaceae sp. FL0255]
MAPDQTPGSGRRKRIRSDNSSPAPSPSVDNVAASAKRRRLNGVSDSPRSTPKGFASITSAIGGVLGRLGRRNKAQDKADDDSLAASSYDVPASDDDHSIAPSRPKKRKLDFGKPTKKTDPVENPYDVPESDDEINQPDPENEPQQSNPATPSKKKLANGVKPRGSSARSAKANNGASLDSENGDLEENTTPRRRGRPPKIKGPLASPAVKSRVYGLSGKHDVDIAPESPKLKGILTPRKDRTTGRPAKSVLFEDDDTIENNTHSKQATPKPLILEAKKDEQEEAVNDNENEEEEDDEEEVCSICLKPDSEPPNEIIFCEVCDAGFHQDCYNVPVIPEGDWICRTCSQEDVLPDVVPPEQVIEKEQTPLTDVTVEIPDIPNFEQHFQTMQRVLLDRCSGKRRLKLRAQDEAYDKAYQLVEQTVLAGEGNSMMVIGGRGCGKTALMEEVITNLQTESPEGFHVVRLNGFIHTDDKLALKEIWRQLGKEMEIEDDLISRTNNYADTMASLLALLSHPTEITGAEADGVTSKSVIFIIDEFELFATHGRQTLLYNLFDIAQARKAPIAVLGLTTRIDVIESLEKRVKSRFSHRYVYLSLPKSLPAYWDICCQGLNVDEGDLAAEGFDLELPGFEEFRQYWDEKIETLRKTPAFEDHLEYHFYTTKSVSAFLTSCILPLSNLSTSSSSSLQIHIPSPPLSSFTGIASALEPPEPKLQLLSALSDLELALLIAAARLDIVAHTDTVNFAMAYDEYSSQMGKQRLQSGASGLLALGAGARLWGRGVAVVAWERLVSLGLLLPAGIGGRSNAAHGGLEGKMWRVDVVLEEIPAWVELRGFLGRWCSQI